MRRAFLTLPLAAIIFAASALSFPVAQANAQGAGAAAAAAPTPPPALSYASARTAPTAPPANAARAISAAAGKTSTTAAHARPAHHRHKPHESTVQSVLHDAEARSTEAPRRPEFVNATLHYAYEPGKLYTIQTAPGFLTAIALRPGEHLVSKAAGDTVRWEVGETAQGSAVSPQVVLLIKPLDADLRTNMILTTDQRTYVLDLVSASGSDHATLVDWSYPADEMHELQIQRAAHTVQALAAHSSTLASGVMAPAMAPSPFITPAGAPPQVGPARLAGPAAYSRPAVQADIAPASLNFDYRIEPKVSRAPGWTPEHVFDDGRKTYVKFPADISTIEIPPLFMIGPKGEAELVNYRFENGYYVVDRLFNVAELRLGSSDQQVIRLVYKGATR